MTKSPNARPYRSFPIRALLTASALALALSSCAKEPPTIGSPPAVDLSLEPEPQLDPAAVESNSAAALDDYDARYGTWGRAGWQKVSRLRKFFCDRGFRAFCD